MRFVPGECPIYRQSKKSDKRRCHFILLSIKDITVESSSLTKGCKTPFFLNVTLISSLSTAMLPRAHAEWSCSALRERWAILLDRIRIKSVFIKTYNVWFVQVGDEVGNGRSCLDTEFIRTSSNIYKRSIDCSAEFLLSFWSPKAWLHVLVMPTTAWSCSWGSPAVNSCWINCKNKLDYGNMWLFSMFICITVSRLMHSPSTTKSRTALDGSNRARPKNFAASSRTSWLLLLSSSSSFTISLAFSS